MKITDITLTPVPTVTTESNKAFEGSPIRSLLKIETDEGVTGIAEAGRNAGIVNAYLNDLIKPLLKGQDPTRPRKSWE